MAKAKRTSVETILEGYFDFLSPEDIRVKGTRVGIETIVSDYQQGVSPEEIAERYPTLTLEQVYATLTYYLRNRPQVDAYVARWRARGEAGWQQQQQQPSEFVQELRERLERQRAMLIAEGKAEYLTGATS